MGGAPEGPCRMKKRGHSEKQVATLGREIQSGAWLRRREGSLKKLATGLRQELSRFPPRVVRGFVAYIVTVVAATEAIESCFSEERRIRDLEEMLAMANQFLETCGRWAVFFHPNQLDFGLTSQAAADKRDAQISDTADLHDAGMAALKAVGLYRLGLEAALETTRRRQGRQLLALPSKIVVSVGGPAKESR
jgi:hypothetical protein